MKKVKIGFLFSHPIQYFAPLMKELAKEKWCDLVVYYCSEISTKAYKDNGFGCKIKWDIELLEGYQYKFLKNYSLRPDVNIFWGLFNPSIFNELRKDQIDVLVLHGWNCLTNALVILLSDFFKCNLLLRSEMPLNQEFAKPCWKIWLKKIILQHIIFRKIRAFLYIGEENRKFYQFYGVDRNRLFFTPYCVDNDYFRSRQLSQEEQYNLRVQFDLSDKVVVLFVGKLISKKRPFDLLYAFKKMPSSIRDQCKVLYVGDGELRRDLELYSKQSDLGACFAGFRNQSELPAFYSISDIFVLPSGHGETWGLVVNEAMNFSLPVLVSKTAGCSADLVSHGRNGFLFEEANIDELAAYLQKLIVNHDLRKKQGEQSLNIVTNYSYQNVINGLREAVATF